MKKTFNRIEKGSAIKEVTIYEFETLEEVGKDTAADLMAGENDYGIKHYAAKLIKDIVPVRFLDELLTRSGFAFVADPGHRADYDEVAILAIEAAIFKASFDLDDEEIEEDGFELASVDNGVSNVVLTTENTNTYNKCVVTVTEVFV